MDTSEDGSDDQGEPNMDFINPLDSMRTFEDAAVFIQKWYQKDSAHNATDFATDFPAVVERSLLIRRTLISLRKAKGFSPETTVDEDGKAKMQEIRKVHKRIYTTRLFETHDDYLINFFLNLMRACSQVEDCPLIIIRILCNHLGWLSRDGKLTINENH